MKLTIHVEIDTDTVGDDHPVGALMVGLGRATADAITAYRGGMPMRAKDSFLSWWRDWYDTADARFDEIDDEISSGLEAASKHFAKQMADHQPKPLAESAPMCREAMTESRTPVWELGA